MRNQTVRKQKKSTWQKSFEMKQAVNGKNPALARRGSLAPPVTLNSMELNMKNQESIRRGSLAPSVTLNSMEVNGKNHESKRRGSLAPPANF